MSSNEIALESTTAFIKRIPQSLLTTMSVYSAKKQKIKIVSIRVLVYQQHPIDYVDKSYTDQCVLKICI